MSSSCVNVCFRIRIPNRVERCQYNRGDFLISQHLSKYALFQKNPKKQGSFNPIVHGVSRVALKHLTGVKHTNVKFQLYFKYLSLSRDCYRAPK